MKEVTRDIEAYLEKLNLQKDEFLFFYLKKHWPRKITPNHLTILRMVISVVLFYALFFLHDSSGIIILPLFFIGILTDLLDGSLARCLHMETHFGEITDPIADRMIIMPVAIYALLGNPLLLVVLIASEILNACISLMAAGKNIFFGSNIFGKVKMFLQSVVFLAILVFWPATPNIFFTYLLWVSVILMVMSLSHKFFAIKDYYHHTS